MKKKIGFTFFMILLYIFIKQVPLMGVISEPVRMSSALTADDFVNRMIYDPSNHSVFLLGFGPWMIAFVIVSIGRGIHSRSDTRYSRSEINRLTMRITFFVALFLAIAKMMNMEYRIHDATSIFYYLLRAGVMAEILFGTFFGVWLGKKNEKYGMGATSVFILVNTMGNMDSFIVQWGMKTFAKGFFPFLIDNRYFLLYALLLLFIGTAFAKAEQRVPLQRLMIHNGLKEGSYLPIKINPAGMLPVMCTLAFFTFFTHVFNWLGHWLPNNGIVAFLWQIWTLNSLFGMMIFFMMYIVFSIAMACVCINPKGIADDMIAAGECIAGVNPGDGTTQYLTGRIRLFGLCSGITMCLCVVLPMAVGSLSTESIHIYVFAIPILIFIGIANEIIAEFQSRQVKDAYRKFHKRGKASLY